MLEEALNRNTAAIERLIGVITAASATPPEDAAEKPPAKRTKRETLPDPRPTGAVLETVDTPPVVEEAALATLGEPPAVTVPSPAAGAETAQATEGAATATEQPTETEEVRLPTYVDAAKVCTRIMKTPSLGTSKAKELLAEFEVQHLQKLAPERYAEFIAAANKVLANV